MGNIMRSDVLSYASGLPSAVSDCPFEDDLLTTVLRHGIDGKWFGILMNVQKKKLGIDDNGTIDILNVKIDPEESYTVREMFEGILPAYHMNKRHWISILLDGTVPMELCEILINKSYDLTRKKIAKPKHFKN